MTCLDVPRDLCFERLKRSKFVLRALEFAEENDTVLPIQILITVKKIGLNTQEILSDGRLVSDIGDSLILCVAKF